MSDVDQLVERYLDDRESLSDEELAELAAALRASNELACELKNQILIDELVAQRLTVDRKDFLAQMRQRVADLHQGSDALDRNVARLRDLAAAKYRRRSRAAQRPRSRLRLYAGAAAALVLLTAMAAVAYNLARNWIRPASVAQGEDAAMATVELAAGTASRIRDGRDEPLSANDRVLPGDKLQTLSDGRLVVRYSDGTRLDISAESLLEFPAARASFSQVRLDHGELSARVAQQPAREPMKLGTPLAQAVVHGTRLLLTADAEHTRLDVLEGVVDLVRASDEERVTVKGQQFAVVSQQLAPSQQFVAKDIAWPSNEQGLVFVSDDYWNPSYRDPESGEFKGGALTPRKNGARVATDPIAEALLIACRRTGSFTVETIVEPASRQQQGLRRIIAFSTDAADANDWNDYNFLLGQQGDQLVLRLKTTVAGQPPAIKQAALWKLIDTQPHHVAVSYRNGQTVCYVDGEPVFESASLAGDFRDWTRQELTFGDEGGGGTLENVAIYNRFMTRNEAARHADYLLRRVRDPLRPGRRGSNDEP